MDALGTKGKASTYHRTSCKRCPWSSGNGTPEERSLQPWWPGEEISCIPKGKSS